MKLYHNINWMLRFKHSNKNKTVNESIDKY